MHSFKDLTKLRNKLRVFKGKMSHTIQGDRINK